jgi:dipeptide/tripeptide permease
MIYTAYELRFVSPLIGGWIADSYSVRASFLLFAAVLLIGGMASLMLKLPNSQKV